MASKVSGLCELHLHLYGCIRWPEVLDTLATAPDLHWTDYENAYQAAFGRPSCARGLVESYTRTGQIDEDAFRRVFEFGDEDAGNFARFSAKFGLLLVGSSVLGAQQGQVSWDETHTEICRVAKSVMAVQRTEGIAYAEQRLRPGPDVPIDVAKKSWSEVLKVYRNASDDGFTSRLAASLPRDDPWGQWETVKELALGPDGAWLTGVDFCHIEEGKPPRQLQVFFEEFRHFNAQNPDRALALLYHVGESFGDKSIESAVRWVHEAADAGAHRLGHAIALGIDPQHFGCHERLETVAERKDQIDYEFMHADGLANHGVLIDEASLLSERRMLAKRDENEEVVIRYDKARLEGIRLRQNYAMEMVRQSGAVIEVCPTSNQRIGGIMESRYHPVHRFVDQQVPFVVASDDPGILGVKLADEIDWIAREVGLNDRQRKSLMERAWRCRSEVLSGRVPFP